jgi:hypothetical protein
VVLGALSQCAVAAPIVEVQRVPDGGLQPQVIAQGATVYLFYFKGDPKAGDLFYASSTNGGATFGTPLRVNSQPGSAIATGTIRGVQAALGRDGILHAVWNGSANAQPRSVAPPEAQKFGTSPLLYARLKNGAFEAQRNLMTKTFNLDGGASVAADNEGRVYVAWHANDQAGQNEGSRRMWLARSTDDGATFSAENPVWNEPTGVCACCQVKPEAAKGGRVLLLYRSASDVVNRDTFLLTSRNGGETFTGAKIHPWKIGACPMSSYAFGGAGDNLLAAWESDDQIFWAKVGFDGKVGPVQAAPGQGANRKHPVLAVNARGEILLAWTDGTGWARGGAVCWQIYDAEHKPLSSGRRAGMPAWSKVAVWARPDGNFGLIF